MSQTTTQKSQDEKDIRQLIEIWRKGVEAKDSAVLVSHYTKDALLYDAIPPYKLIGPDAIRKSWDACMPYMPARMKATHRDIEMTIDGDMAVVHCLFRMDAIGEESPCGMSWMRVTICLRRIDGKWQAFHEHISIPFDPMSSKVANITDPDNPGELPPPPTA